MGYDIYCAHCGGVYVLSYTIREVVLKQWQCYRCNEYNSLTEDALIELLEELERRIDSLECSQYD